MKMSWNRRAFLETTALSTAALSARLAAAAEERNAPGGLNAITGLPPARIHRVYAGRSGDDYLTRPTEEFHRIEHYLSELATKLGDVEFTGGELIPGVSAESVVPRVKEADALLIIHLSGHGGDAPALTKLVDVGRPTAVFSQPFSGHGWMDFPLWHKQGKRVVLFPTSDWTALDRAAGMLRASAWLKQSRVLAVGGPHGTKAACTPELVKERLGVDLVAITQDRVLEYMRSIDPKEAESEAEAYWLSQARKVVEPTRPDIIESARMYLGIRKLMAEEKAQAICSQACMGTPRGCLTFSKLNDLGLVGGCEGDIDSTLTMLIFAYAFRVPGFISDPVIDTARNAIVHFHCTSATRLDGPSGPRLPFTIRSQTDSRGGVALEVENRVGQPVTCAKLVNLDAMLYVPGEIVETSTSPLACRTQFTQRVPDARRLFLEWGGDVLDGDTMTRLHRVVFYGDFTRPLQDLGDLLGFKPIEEGAPAARA
jgi:hypothetical protein